MKPNKNKQNSANLYGFHAVREAWLNENRLIHALYLTEQAQRGFESTILSRLKKKS